MSSYQELNTLVPPELTKNIRFKTAGSKKYGNIIAGCGVTEHINDEIKKFNHDSVFLVSDRIISDLWFFKEILSSLERVCKKVEVFLDVESEPSIETAVTCQELVKKNKYDVVIGLGGGSVLDIAKIASISVGNSENIKFYLSGNSIENEGAPLILIPTTSGTGSEVSPYIVLSDTEKKKKVFIGDPCLYSTIALIDPLLTSTMPPHVTASTGLDALTHGVEGVVGNENPYSEIFSNKCVEFVFKYLKNAYQNGKDIEARYYMSLSSLFGMLSYAQGGGLYSHSISYILTNFNKLPHGVGCGLSLPHTLKYNKEFIRHILIRFFNIVNPQKFQLPDDEKAEEMIQMFYQLLETLEVKPALKDYDIPENKVHQFSDELINIYYRNRNPRKLTHPDALNLMNKIWTGQL